MKEYFLDLQDYIVWLNHRIFFAADRVPQDEYLAEREYHHGSLHGCLLHTLAGEYVWRVRCAEKTTPTLDFLETELTNLEELRMFWQKEHRAMHDYLKTLKPENFSSDIEFENSQGEIETFPLVTMLTQNYFHSEQLLTEASMLLTDLDQSPGSIDYLIYFMEKAV